MGSCSLEHFNMCHHAIAGAAGATNKNGKHNILFKTKLNPNEQPKLNQQRQQNNSNNNNNVTTATTTMTTM